MTLRLIGKGIVIAFIAAAVAWLSVVGYFGVIDGELHLDPNYYFVQAIPLALMGSYCIGLPVALLTFVLSKDHLIRSPKTLATITALAGVMMVLAALTFGDEFTALVFGLPAAVAGAVFAVLGWFWILKPMRGARYV